MERIREPIRIAAVFTPGQRLKPVWFDWRRRQHRILETTYTWQEQVGETTFLHFSVTDGGALYELVYNTTEQSWLLNGVEAK
jgi:hypothetical protein